jgi:hypothetical protein
MDSHGLCLVKILSNISIFSDCYLTFVKRAAENFLAVAGEISEFFLNLVAESQQKDL